MNKKNILFSFALICAALPAFSQDPDSIMIKKLTDEILLRGKAYSNLYTLCKTVGQRLSGSEGMYKGEEWGQATLKASAAERVYLQECMVPHWVRGAKEYAGFKTHKRANPRFNVLAIGNSVGTGKDGVLAPVIEVANFDELER